MALIINPDTEALVTTHGLFHKKWTLIIINEMLDMLPQHYLEIKNRIEGINDSGLAEGLIDLVGFKMVVITFEDSETQIKSYSLSKLGISVRPLINANILWEKINC